MAKKIVVVMPAYNAEDTLEKTYSEIPFEIVDDVILVDDASHDRTSEIALRSELESPALNWNPLYPSLRNAVAAPTALEQTSGRPAAANSCTATPH